MKRSPWCVCIGDDDRGDDDSGDDDDGDDSDGDDDDGILLMII